MSSTYQSRSLRQRYRNTCSSWMSCKCKCGSPSQISWLGPRHHKPYEVLQPSPVAPPVSRMGAIEAVVHLDRKTKKIIT